MWVSMSCAANAHSTEGSSVLTKLFCELVTSPVLQCECCCMGDKHEHTHYSHLHVSKRLGWQCLLSTDAQSLPSTAQYKFAALSRLRPVQSMYHSRQREQSRQHAVLSSDSFCARLGSSHVRCCLPRGCCYAAPHTCTAKSLCFIFLTHVLQCVFADNPGAASEHKALQQAGTNDGHRSRYRWQHSQHVC